MDSGAVRGVPRVSSDLIFWYVLPFFEDVNFGEKKAGRIIKRPKTTHSSMSHQSTTDHQEFSPDKLGISPITTAKVLAAISTKAIFWQQIFCGSADGSKKWGSVLHTRSHKGTLSKTDPELHQRIQTMTTKKWWSKRMWTKSSHQQVPHSSNFGIGKGSFRNTNLQFPKNCAASKSAKKVYFLRNLDQELFRISSEFRDHLKRFHMMNWLNESIMNHLRTSSTCVANKIPSTLPFFSLRLRLKTTLLIHDTTISLWRLKIDSNHEKNLYQQP